jgi:hypothetical protein
MDDVDVGRPRLPWTPAGDGVGRTRGREQTAATVDGGGRGRRWASVGARAGAAAVGAGQRSCARCTGRARVGGGAGGAAGGGRGERAARRRGRRGSVEEEET